MLLFTQIVSTYPNDFKIHFKVFRYLVYLFKTSFMALQYDVADKIMMKIILKLFLAEAYCKKSCGTLKCEILGKHKSGSI